MRLQLCTWQEVEDYLQRSTGIIIPIGSTEQHGPNGLIGTDAICPETIAHALGEETGVLIGPTLNLGMAQHHMGFPGTITLRPSTLIAVIRDTVESLARHGFTHVFFLNGHGGNITTVQAAFAEIHAHRSLGQMSAADVRLTLFNWFLGPRVRQLARKLYADAEGGHATPSEVSLSYYAFPEAVKQVKMQPRIAPSGGVSGDAAEFRRRYPDGRMGSDPSLASGEHGKRFLEAGVKDAREAWGVFLEG